MNSKKQYLAPELTVVSFKTERGYALSGGDKGLFDFSRLEYEEGFNSQSQQDWHEESSFFGSSSW